MDKSYYTYVLKCADNTFYCGYTDDVQARLITHNTGKGAKYTRGRLPVSLLTSVEFPDKETAMKCEWWFKNKIRTRTQKSNLIKNHLLKEEFEEYQKTREK